MVNQFLDLWACSTVCGSFAADQRELRSKMCTSRSIGKSILGAPLAFKISCPANYTQLERLASQPVERTE